MIEIIFSKAREESAEYIMNNASQAIICYSREDLWRYSISLLEPNENLSGSPTKSIAEFGVYEGESINFFADQLPSYQTYGFDSFCGLAEDWKGFSYLKGKFDLKGHLPAIRNNVL